MSNAKYHKTFCKLCGAPLVLRASDEAPKDYIRRILDNAICDKCKERRKQYREALNKHIKEVASKMNHVVREEQHQHDKVAKFYSRLDNVIEWLTILSIVCVMLVNMSNAVFGKRPLAITFAAIIIVFMIRILIGMFLVDMQVKKQDSIKKEYDKKYAYPSKELKRLEKMKHDYSRIIRRATV